MASVGNKYISNITVVFPNVEIYCLIQVENKKQKIDIYISRHIMCSNKHGILEQYNIVLYILHIMEHPYYLTLVVCQQ